MSGVCGSSEIPGSAPTLWFAAASSVHSGRTRGSQCCAPFLCIVSGVARSGCIHDHHFQRRCRVACSHQCAGGRSGTHTHTHTRGIDRTPLERYRTESGDMEHFGSGLRLSDDAMCSGISSPTDTMVDACQFVKSVFIFRLRSDRTAQRDSQKQTAEDEDRLGRVGRTQGLSGWIDVSS